VNILLIIYKLLKNKVDKPLKKTIICLESKFGRKVKTTEKSDVLRGMRL